ncbi:LysR family transcriptional regulator [Rhizobium sp. P38BS-XIX]|uniref:LysR family transcriptional regulator n=1 Tax=Rhizobium sp. P38BS-XIX TaxID=2726740 RepID=UPI0014575712|nr:LysR family transcriptional regulator [Rhizobium sp. P38BS-XIX]NLR98385.1 LysR family transcriptional regulator [Rhizobium sp. P38BS-XIX]
MKASLAELEAIASVARHGGFRAAARELGMSSSALSHAVAALEERLSVRIFNRTTRSVTLSEAGERFVADIGPALAAIDRAIEDAGMKSGSVSGVLRLNMAPGAARILLVSLILEYRRRYPDVEIEIVTDNALVDVIGKGFDAGIRLAEAVPTDMVAIPIVSTLRSLVVGSPGYFSDRPRPLVPADLLQHRCIRARMASGRLYRWEFERHGQTMLIDAPGTLTLDASDLMLSAALEGAGLAYISESSIADHVAAGRLVTVLEDWSPPYPGLSLYFAQRRQMPARLRALIDLIREQNAARDKQMRD